MPIEMVQIRHKKTKALSNTPRSQLPRYEANGWEEVKGATVIQPPLAVSAQPPAEPNSKESSR